MFPLCWWCIPCQVWFCTELSNLFRGILFTRCVQLLLYSSNLSKIGAIFNSFAICAFVSPFKTLSIDVNLITLAGGLCCYVRRVTAVRMKYWYHQNRHSSDGSVVSCYRHQWLWADCSWLGQLYVKTNEGRLRIQNSGCYHKRKP